MNNRVPYGPGSWPCPSCGAHSEVRDSRPSDALGVHAICRRRHCSNGHRFTTFEISQEDVEVLRGPDPKMMDRAKRAVTELADFFKQGVAVEISQDVQLPIRRYAVED